MTAYTANPFLMRLPCRRKHSHELDRFRAEVHAVVDETIGEAERARIVTTAALNAIHRLRHRNLPPSVMLREIAALQRLMRDTDQPPQ